MIQKARSKHTISNTTENSKVTLKELQKLNNINFVDQNIYLDTEGKKVKYYEIQDNGNLKFIDKRSFGESEKVEVWSNTTINSKGNFLIIGTGSQLIEIPESNTYLYIGAAFLTAGIIATYKYMSE